MSRSRQRLLWCLPLAWLLMFGLAHEASHACDGGGDTPAKEKSKGK